MNASISSGCILEVAIFYDICDTGRAPHPLVWHSTNPPPRSTQPHNHTTTAKTQRNTAKTRRNTKGPFKLNISQNFGNFLKSVQLLSRSLCSSSWIAFPQLATSSKDFSSSRAKEEFFAKEDDLVSKVQTFPITLSSLAWQLLQDCSSATTNTRTT